MKRKYSLMELTLTAIGTAAVTLFAVFAIGFSRYGGKEGVEFLNKMDLMRRIIKSEYVGEIEWDAVADGACSGAVEALGDRWSYYMTAEEYDAYRLRESNTSSGIGVIVKALGEGGIEIVTVLDGSPAEAAGLEPGQVIVSLNGQDVSAMNTTQLRELIMEQDGEFELGLLDAGGDEISVTVYRDTFYSAPVSFEMLEGEIGYIRIVNFDQGAAEHTLSAMEELMASGAQSLLFDVRSNNGGFLTELIDILDHLLPEGDVFISLDRDGREEIYTSDAECVDLPMAVLINGSTYSAAEFFAAALSEYGRAVIVGAPSTGKGRSQITIAMTDGSAVHISTRRYLTPNRVDLSEQGGLTPDIVVEQSAGGDAQLDAAVKYLS